MKPRKCFALLLLLCTLALLCTACASTTALDNIGTYYSEVGAVLDDWFASSSGGGVSGGGEGAAAAALDAPGSFTLDENGNYSFTGVADADYYLVYFCAPDATSDSDPLPLLQQLHRRHRHRRRDLFRKHRRPGPVRLRGVSGGAVRLPPPE